MMSSREGQRSNALTSKCDERQPTNVLGAAVAGSTLCVLNAGARATADLDALYSEAKREGSLNYYGGGLRRPSESSRRFRKILSRD